MKKEYGKGDALPFEGSKFFSKIWWLYLKKLVKYYTKNMKTSGINSMNAIERNIPPEKVFEIPINFWFVWKFFLLKTSKTIYFSKKKPMNWKHSH